MGLLMLFGFFVPVIVGSVLYWINDKLGYLFIMFLSLPLLIILVLVAPINPPVQDYPYQASVTLDNTDSRQTIICFSKFSQNSNEVIIDTYTKSAITHWTDFKGYDVITSPPLVIILTDNNNQFIYKDRITGEVFNNNVKGKVKVATQP